jgi:hypothetical protein
MLYVVLYFLPLLETVADYVFLVVVVVVVVLILLLH